MSAEDWTSVFTRTIEELNFVKCPNDELCRNLKVIRENVTKLVILAKALNYGEINANGYWSFIKVCVKFCHVVENDLRDIENSYNHLVSVSRYLVALLVLMENQKEIPSDDSKSSSEIANGSLNFAAEFHTVPFRYEDELAIILGKYPGFWLAPSLSNVYARLSTVFAISSSPLQHVTRFLWDKTHNGTLAMRAMMNPDFARLAPIQKLFVTLAVPVLRFFTNYNDVTCTSISVKSKSPFVIDHDLKKDLNRSPPAVINCRLIECKSKVQEPVVVLHCHGGGFFSGAPDIDELFYLRSWCHQLQGCTILSVDYKLFTPFPQPLQQLLDVYFWLTQDTNATQRLGFHPSRVVLCGDSVGALLVFQLLLVLHDVQERWNQKHTVMPSSVVCIQGLFCVCPAISPSRVLSLIDTALFATTMTSVAKEYAGIQREQGKVPSN